MSITINVDLREKLNAPRDQGVRPTCLVFAATSAHEVRRGSMEYLSPEYLFYCGAQRTHKDPNRGLSPEAAHDALLHDGQPPEAAWPYLSALPNVASWKPPSTKQTAHQATLEFAARTVAEVRSVLKNGTPVILMMMATVAMYTPDAQGVIRACVGDKPTSRHALLAVGSGHAVDGEYLLVRNSWGLTWGLAGHGWLHDLYLGPLLEMTGILA